MGFVRSAIGVSDNSLGKRIRGLGCIDNCKTRMKE